VVAWQVLRQLVLVLGQDQEVLKVRIFHNLLDGLTICGAQALFDDQRPQCQTRRLGPLSSVTAGNESGVLVFHLIPGDVPGQKHPSIVTLQPAAERKIEILKRHLIQITLRVHPSL